MPDDASNDWLDVAKTRAQGIRTALAGIGVFVACLLVTIFSQSRQYEADLKAEAKAVCFVNDPTLEAGQTGDAGAPKCSFEAAADWGILQAAYEEFPVQQIDAELTPWNQFAMESTLVATFTEGIDPNKFAGNPDPRAKFFWLLEQASLKTPVKKGSTNEISHFYKDLKGFDANARSIEWAVNAKIPFENLDRDKVIALANAFTFNLDAGDGVGEYAAKELANAKFTAELNSLRPTVLNSQGHPIMEENFVQTLVTGASLDQFTTLRQQLTVYDLAKFDHVDDADMTSKLLPFLANTPFTSLATERNEYTRLINERMSILKGESAITLPFLNLSVNLSDFAYLSSILNLAFLGWIFWEARQMDDAVDRYLTFADSKRARLEAALLGLPRTGRWNLLSTAGFALVVTMPALLGSFVLFAPVWFLKGAIFRSNSLLYLFLPLVVFAMSLALVTYVQKSNRGVLDVLRNPRAGVAPTPQRDVAVSKVQKSGDDAAANGPEGSH
jgi:hypothetical protein